MQKNKTKILLVEDDKFISEIYCRKLSENDFEVELAQNGMEAVQFFKNFRPDLVLLDVMLPQKSGWEVLREIKAIKGINSRIIMLTNLGEREKIKKALEMGAEDYLIKSSLTPSELVELIKNKI